MDDTTIFARFAGHGGTGPLLQPRRTRGPNDAVFGAVAYVCATEIIFLRNIV